MGRMRGSIHQSLRESGLTDGRGKEASAGPAVKSWAWREGTHVCLWRIHVESVWKNHPNIVRLFTPTQDTWLELASCPPLTPSPQIPLFSADLMATEYKNL